MAKNLGVHLSMSMRLWREEWDHVLAHRQRWVAVPEGTGLGPVIAPGEDVWTRRVLRVWQRESVRAGTAGGARHIEGQYSGR